MMYKPTCILLVVWSVAVTAAAGQTHPEKSRKYLHAVRTFADNVLRYGRDTYGPEPTPLLIDGINVDTHEPAVWVLPDDCVAAWKMPKRWVMCNPASQQVLFRVFDALTTLTGDPKYHQVAADAMAYAMNRFAYDDGLLFWGGHAMIDLATKTVVGESHKDWSQTPTVPIPANWDTGAVHELKFHYPYYELMWQVNPEGTQRFVLAFWASHVQDWRNLDMNRHGIYGRYAGLSWDREYEGGPVPFNGRGLSFIHTGSDMVYAAALLSEFNGDKRPLTWAKRLAARYDDIRHPKTGLAADVYNFYHNERLLAQFGPEFGDRLTETTIASLHGGRYSYPPICLLKLADRLGTEGDDFRRLALADLTAFARHAYDPADNSFQPMLIDGTKLSPGDIKRPGVLDPDTFRKKPARSISFWAYALAGSTTDDRLLWNTARGIARGLGLGELGDTAGERPRLEMQADNADPYLIFALLDLHRATGHRDYLELATRVGDNLLAREFHKGFFVASENHLFARFNSLAPLALLYLEVAGGNRSVRLPHYYGGISYFHCDYEDKGRTYDKRVIYTLRRR